MSKKRIYLLYFILISFLFPILHNDVFTQTDDTAQVTAEGGLTLRDTPSVKGKKAGLIPEGSTVKIISKKSEEAVIAGKKGHWTKVEWQGKRGWVFGAYLSDIKNIADRKGRLKILSVSPMGETSGERESDVVQVTFSEPVVALSMLGEPLTSGPISFVPKTTGRYKWLGTSTVAFYPDKPFPKNSLIKAKVKRGIRSVSGSILENDYSWSFETIRPRLLRSEPYIDSYSTKKWVEIDTNIYLFFSMEMDKDRANRYITLQENGFGKEYKLRYIKRDELKQWERKNFRLKTALVIVPSEKFKRSSNVVIDISYGLPALEGSLGTKQASRLEFNTYNEFQYTGSKEQSIYPVNRRHCDALLVKFTNPVHYKDLMSHLKFSPEIKISPSAYESSTWESDEFCVSLNYKPETKYRLVIDKGLKDIFKQSLGRDIEIEVDVKSYRTWFSMSSGLGVVEAYEGRKIPVSVANPMGIFFSGSSVDMDNVIPMLLWQNYFYIPYNLKHTYTHVDDFARSYKPEFYKPFEPRVERNKITTVPLYLSPLLKGSSGFLHLNMGGPHPTSNKAEFKTFLQVTNLGVTGKFSAERNMLFVTDLKKGTPVKGAHVELRDDFNKVLWKGKTSKDGTVFSPGWKNLGLKKYSSDAVRQWAFIVKDGDRAFINNEWGTGISPWDFDVSYDDNPVFPYFQGNVTTERGIYRPGETVFFKGVLREKIKGDWKIPGKNNVQDLQFEIKNSRGKKIKEGKLRLNQFGAFDFKYMLNKEAPTGYYSVNIFQKRPENSSSRIRPYEEREIVEIKGYAYINGSFRVEVFQPLQFDVKIRCGDKTYYRGDNTDFKITGWYLFGAPMSDKKVSYTISARESYYRPSGHQGFNFSIMQWLDDKYQNPEAVSLASKEDKLNKKGELDLTAKMDTGKDFHSLDISAEATVYGEDQQRVSGRTGLIVHGSDYYVGIKRKDYFVEQGKKAEFEVITVSPDGKSREEDDVTIKVYRRYWESVRKAGVGGRYSWESRKVDKFIMEETVKSRKKAVSFSFIPEKTGLYFLRAESKDRNNRIARADEYFYSTGSEYSPWFMTDDDRIEIVPDKTNYRPGETARILIKSPYESSTALVTVEREFVLSSKVVYIKGTASVIDVPVKKEYLPNVYVCVSLVKGRIKGPFAKSKDSKTDLGKPSFKIGYTSIGVSPEGRHLVVDIKKDHNVRQPGEPLKVSFRIKDRKGRGVKSECMVAVCDEGVLKLIGYRTPDFFNAFYGYRPLGVMTSDTRLHIIGQRNYGEKGEDRGGGGDLDKGKSGMGMDLFTFRKNFLSTAFYKASLVTDDKGQGEVSFNMPDNLTKFRIMVTAITKDSFFGAGEDNVTVKKHLMLKSTLPQFAIAGDSFMAGAVVYNYTEKDVRIHIKISSENAEIQGSDYKEIFVKKGESADARFSFKCEKPGDVTVRIAAKANDFKDAIEKKFVVKVPRLVESVALFESSDKDKSLQKVIIPAMNEVFPGAGFLQVYLSQTAFSGLKGGMDYLLEYPYGCLEQRLSKAYPIVLSKRLILDLNLTKYKEMELDRIVKDMLKELPNFQSHNGGFCYWTNKGMVYPWLSAYACMFMLKAEKEGYKIDKDVLKKGLKYLEDYSKDASTGNIPYSQYCHLATKAYIAYVLALGGKQDLTLINKLYDEIDRIPLFGQANLLKAMYHAGYSGNFIDRVRQKLFNRVKVASTTAHFEDSLTEGLFWIHSSSVRATSIILQSFMETKTKNPLNSKVVNWLVRKRKHKARFDNTQENVTAFWAMTDYYKFYEKAEPDFKAVVNAEGRELLSQTFKGRTAPAFKKDFDFSQFTRGRELPFSFMRKGKGRLYYGLRLNYAPRKLLESRDEGIRISKWYETLDGRRVEDREFKAGKDYVAVLKVYSEQERHFVMMDDPVPAGFKILNLSFQSESREAYKNVKRSSRYWGSFNHFEQYDDKVLVFADSLLRGDHTYRYVVRAVTPGKYLLPPSKIEEMYDPDVFGYYGQQYLEVK